MFLVSHWQLCCSCVQTGSAKGALRRWQHRLLQLRETLVLCCNCFCVEAGCGSIEEVISRDVPRTFPEHPLFHTAAGQQQLLRVLKAYAAADPEVSVMLCCVCTNRRASSVQMPVVTAAAAVPGAVSE